MKCPECDVELTQVGDLFYCPNDHCGYLGNKALWDALITSKLETRIALDTLQCIASGDEWERKVCGEKWDNFSRLAQWTIEQIEERHKKGCNDE